MSDVNNWLDTVKETPAIIGSESNEPAENAGAIDEVVEAMRDEGIADCVGLNETDGRIYVRGRLPWADAPETRPWGTLDDSQLIAWLQTHKGAKKQDRVFAHALNVVATGNKFNPIAEAIAALPPWDGKCRVGSLFSVFLGAEQTEYVFEAETLFMQAAYERAVKSPGVKFDYVPILVGAQGLKKSSLLRKMALSDDFFTDYIGDISKKDGAENIQGVWIVEFGELAALNKRESEDVKAFLTRTQDAYRPSYGKYREVRPRRCVFAGTTNRTQFLKDPTGNRRFLPILCGACEPLLDVFSDEGAAYIAQAWAEVAARRETEGAPCLTLTPESEMTAREMQEWAEEDDADLGEIGSYLGGWPVGKRVCSKQIAKDALGIEEPKQAVTKKVCEMMRTKFPDWEYVGRVTVGSYGKQRAWERKR